MARPIVWNSEVKNIAITEIISRISDGESCRAILDPKLRGDNLPSHRLFIEWLSNDDELRKQYARACELRADAIFDEMFEIADDGSNDYMQKLKGDEMADVLNSEHVQRSKLRIDTRKWALSKMNPKKYGDSSKVDLTNSDGTLNPAPDLSNLSPEEIKEFGRLRLKSKGL